MSVWFALLRGKCFVGVFPHFVIVGWRKQIWDTAGTATITATITATATAMTTTVGSGVTI